MLRRCVLDNQFGICHSTKNLMGSSQKTKACQRAADGRSLFAPETRSGLSVLTEAPFSLRGVLSKHAARIETMY
jgi:hypothetical protein